jgi:hypothetical protein
MRIDAVKIRLHLGRKWNLAPAFYSFSSSLDNTRNRKRLTIYWGIVSFVEMGAVEAALYLGV